jgi:DNA recombination-dependent growth factor C
MGKGCKENCIKNQKNMKKLEIHSEEELAQVIARIANRSRELADKMREKNRDMTEEEAYAQLGQSASLLQAVIAYANRTK